MPLSCLGRLGLEDVLEEVEIVADVCDDILGIQELLEGVMHVLAVLGRLAVYRAPAGLHSLSDELDLALEFVTSGACVGELDFKHSDVAFVGNRLNIVDERRAVLVLRDQLLDFVLIADSVECAKDWFGLSPGGEVCERWMSHGSLFDRGRI